MLLLADVFLACRQDLLRPCLQAKSLLRNQNRGLTREPIAVKTSYVLLSLSGLRQEFCTQRPPAGLLRLHPSDRAHAVTHSERREVSMGCATHPSATTRRSPFVIQTRMFFSCAVFVGLSEPATAGPPLAVEFQPVVLRGGLS